MKNFLITTLVSLMLTSSANADTDGENNISNKNPGPVQNPNPNPSGQHGTVRVFQLTEIYTRGCHWIPYLLA